MKKDQKKGVISTHQAHKKDTGSAKVQVAILTEDIKNLTEHMKIHKKDNSSRRGLMKKVSKRRRLLQYMKINQTKDYHKIADTLGIKKS